MKTMKLILTTAVFVAAAFVHAQAWSDAYDKAVAAANAGQWSDARDAFKEAATSRADDSDRPTSLGGSLLERKTWRNGSLYSPNFGAAYSVYKMGLAATDKSESIRLLSVATQEGEALVNKGQVSREIILVLKSAYSKLGDLGVEGAEMASQKAAGMMSAAKFHVDNSFVASQDMEASGAEPTKTQAPQPREVKPTKVSGSKVKGVKGNSTFYYVKAGEYNNINDIVAESGEAVVPKPEKFALVIGNSESKFDDPKLDFAANDAQLVKDKLISDAGYPAANVVLLTNVSAEQINQAAKELASRVPEYGKVLIYFTGAASNVDGKDYLSGVNASSPNDTSEMIGKVDLFRVFMARGARIFSFFQVNRVHHDGNAFGTEVPRVGMISQMESTLVGTSVTASTNGKSVTGVFTKAFTDVLGQFHTNEVPLFEFAWQVFYNMRRGGLTGTGGGSEQTPTLPVLSNMASDEPF